MYDFLRGVPASLDTSHRLALDVNGVGYSLRISEQTRARVPLDGSACTLWVRLIVREDDLLLFGFADPAERAAFDQLTSVQGVGPVVAMSILSALGVGELRRALGAKDRRALTAIKGVGAKLAERLVLELADRIDRIPGPALSAPTPGAQVADDVARALVALGFGAAQAAEAVAACQQPGLGSEPLLRACLARLR